MVFGYAISTDIDETATFVVDHDQTQASRALVEALTASGYFEVVGRSDRPVDLTLALDRGDAVVGLEIPRGFAARLHAGQRTHVQILLDGTNSNTAAVAQGYAERIVSDHARRLAAGAPPPAIDLRERPGSTPISRAATTTYRPWSARSSC